MKVQFNFFGGPVTWEPKGYSVCVSSYCDDEYYDRQAWDVALTYWGALFMAWRLARRYAKLEMVDQHMFVYEGTGESKGKLLNWRTLVIKKSVSFWSN